MSDATPTDLSAPTEARIAEAIAVWGEKGVVDRAIGLIHGLNAGDNFLLFVGGKHAQGILDGAPVLYWPELWGVRTLLYVWDDSAAEAVASALDNQAWRVREMAARVVAARSLPLVTELSALLTDEVPRVRAAAARALGAVGPEEHEEGIRRLLRDQQIDVRRAAQQALDALRSRA